MMQGAFEAESNEYRVIAGSRRVDKRHGKTMIDAGDGAEMDAHVPFDDISGDEKSGGRWWVSVDIDLKASWKEHEENAIVQFCKSEEIDGMQQKRMRFSPADFPASLADGTRNKSTQQLRPGKLERMVREERVHVATR